MFIKKLFLKYPKQKKFLLALSGGVDSTVLLHQLLIYKKKINNLRIRAIHINHNLYSHSVIAQKHCQDLCKSYNISIITENINIPKKNKYGIEGFARIQRLKIFKKYLLPNEILLQAHNLNDQCENFFLMLKRKSGINGLSGIKFSSTLNDIKIVRPFISIQKEKIISWAKKKKIKWVEDKSNQLTKYDRNFIRKTILLQIYTRWPKFLQNCTMSMKILANDQKTLNCLISMFLKKNTFLDGSLSLINFCNLKLEAKYSILKQWLKKKCKYTPTYNVLKRIYQEIILNNNYYNKKIIFHNGEIRRFKKQIYYIIPNSNIKNTIISWNNIFKPLKLPENLGYLISKKKFFQKKNKNIFKIPCPLKNTLINIRFYIKKKYINKNINQTINIKKICQKNNIPPWLRNIIPLLFYNEELIAGIGIFSTKNYIKKINKKYITISWMNKIN
ncbi:tRNA(Ile)-lysidine synthase [Buchnera aphidicola (Cinara piceae)]|uniref:tRNA(Ile)-lysidine synthase n=1 Tax=Buchnera aphidicola (Cinara piceae) TaxID=1660043 RepID=A0A803FTF7_9GAMM|nr:tRNA lysidine(34) synthetase TilS [Buchnera aphidicola]VFP87959.1 tRNA(Ile)-lysidine synthase [Buchnera aphidicola (Cinara piceae)]